MADGDFRFGGPVMFIARWQIDARFGHKQEALELM